MHTTSVDEWQTEGLRQQRRKMGEAQAAMQAYADVSARLAAMDRDNLAWQMEEAYSLSNLGTMELEAGRNRRALEYFERIPTYQLSRSERAEVKFKMGYANFVKKKFAQAKGHFDEVKEYSNSEYYYPTNYYLAMIAFYDGDYDAALRGFRLVEKSRQYERDVPYYIAQILFAEKKYDELIAYAEPYARAASIRKAKEMNQLVGQAYFEKGNYAAALPYLEAYANMMGRLTETEWYQLGYAQYQQQKYRKHSINDAYRHAARELQLFHAVHYRIAQRSQTRGYQKRHQNRRQQPQQQHGGERKNGHCQFFTIRK